MSCSVQIKSRNTVKMKKVNNVVHRTTSETLRLSEPEVLMNNTSRQALSAISPPIHKKSSCSFQITGVSLTQRTDLGDDSADDLDESHTDDISRVTDNETPSFSEDTCSRDTEDNIVDSCSALCSVTVIPTVPEFELEDISSEKTSFITTADFCETSIDHLTFIGDMASNPPPTTTKNQRFPGTRFTVVKIETGVPVRRGRWECLDYIDNSVYTPKHALTYNSPTTSDLSSTNTQPHYTMTPTTPTIPMQGDFAALGTNYIENVNKLLQSLSPSLQGVTQGISTSPLESPLSQQQLSLRPAVPPSLSSPILQQDYTAILSNLLTAQLRNTTSTQQSTTLPVVNPQILNQTSGFSSQDAIRSLQSHVSVTTTLVQGQIQSQPLIHSIPVRTSVSAAQIQSQPLLQALYSTQSLPITSINVSTALGAEAPIQNQISGYPSQTSISLNQSSLPKQQNVQIQSGIGSTLSQGQQQMMYPLRADKSMTGYLSQPLYSIHPQIPTSSSAPMISLNQGSAHLQHNVQLQPIYSTPGASIQGQASSAPMISLNQGSAHLQHNVQLQPIYSTPGASIQGQQLQQQTIYSSPTPGLPLAYSPAQGSQFQNKSEGGIQNQSPAVYSSQQSVLSRVTEYSTQPQISLQSLPSQTTSYSAPTLSTDDYVARAKEIIMQLQNQSQMQLQNLTYSTTQVGTSASQIVNQTSLPLVGQSASYLQQRPEVEISVTNYSTPSLRRQMSLPPQLSNQSSMYLPQQINTNYSSQSSNLMSQVSSQPQVPNLTTSYVSVPQNLPNLTSIPSQPSTNYLFQTSASSQNYLPSVQSQPYNYVTQSYTPLTNSSSYISQTLLPNQAGYYMQDQTIGRPLQNQAQDTTHFRRSQLSELPHNYIPRPPSQLTDHFSSDPTQLRNYSTNPDDILQTSCSVIQLHRHGQPASYVALPQDHGAYVLHHIPTLSMPRKSASAHQSRLHTQTSIHSYIPHTEKSPPYVHQPGPAHNLTHQVPAQKRRLVGQTLNFSLEPENDPHQSDSRSSVFSFTNRDLSSTYSKTRDVSTVSSSKSVLLPRDSTTVTASIMKPIVIGSVTPSKTTPEKSKVEHFLDKLSGLDIPHSTASDVVERLEQVLEEVAAGSEIAIMELKPAANNTSAIIDTKIEQAMDLVKSHLLYTVREEVEVLKLRISELLTRINQLEKENSFLKANATPEVLSALNTRSEEVHIEETSFSTVATPKGDVNAPAVPIE